MFSGGAVKRLLDVLVTNLEDLVGFCQGMTYHHFHVPEKRWRLKLGFSPTSQRLNFHVGISNLAP